MFIIFNGRSAANILGDAQEEFPDEAGCLVITLDNDQLVPPEGVASVTVGAFEPAVGETYRVIANGGTTGQALPVVKKLVEASATFSAWDLQRDRCVQVW